MGRSTIDNLPRVDRRALAAEWRAWHARVCDFRARLGVEAPERCERADALDRGEPVEVANWELPHDILPPGALVFGPYFYVIEPDGSLRTGAA